MELIITSVLVFLAVLVYALMAVHYLVANRILFRQRVKAYSPKMKIESAIQEELSMPLRERLTRPLQGIAKALPAKALSAVTIDGLTTKLMLAGYPGNLTAAEFIALRYSLAVLFPLVVIVGGVISGTSLARLALTLVLAGLVGYLSPDVFLKIKRSGRQMEIRRQLPDVLDLLTVSVEAGLGFDAAIAKVVEKMEGPFPQELGRLLQEIKMGKPRREALKDLQDRIDVDSVNSFVSAVIQADQLGVSMGNVLRIQSKDIREKRRQEAQEQAQKAPIKIIFPVVLFIFPALFIVILGPAVLNFMDSFANM